MFKEKKNLRRDLKLFEYNCSKMNKEEFIKWMNNVYQILDFSQLSWTIRFANKMYNINSHELAILIYNKK